MLQVGILAALDKLNLFCSLLTEVQSAKTFRGHGLRTEVLSILGGPWDLVMIGVTPISPFSRIISR